MISKVVKLNRNTANVATILAIVLVVALGTSIVASVDTYVPSFDYTVVIDAGHGGIDGGVSGVSTKTKESDLNLSIALKIKSFLRQYGVNVILTRDSSDGLYGTSSAGFKRRDMQKRRDIIKSSNADLLVSIHMNMFPISSRRGAQVFFQKGDLISKQFADLAQKEINEFTKYNFNALSADYFILKCNAVSSVLIECGFLSNEQDEKLLIDDKYQMDISKVISDAIVAYMYIGKIDNEA